MKSTGHVERLQPSFRRSSSGSLAKFTAMRGASSLASSLAAERRVGIERLGKRANRSALQRLQIRDHVGDLARIELEFRHRRMTSDDAFGERFLETFDRIALVQSAERLRRRERARAHLVD